MIGLTAGREFAGVRSYQSCHMQVIEGEMVISSVVGVPRENVSRHVFRGGNIIMPRILNAHRQELAVTALPQELQTTAQQSAENLQTAAASVSLVNTKICKGTIQTEIVITNLAGHNLGDHEAEEIERFIGYYEEMAESSAVVLASANAVAD